MTCGKRPYPFTGMCTSTYIGKQAGKYLKGNFCRKLQMEYKELNKQFFGQHLWAGGYFVASSGNLTDEIIQEYTKNQDLQEKMKSDNFEIRQI